MSRNLNNNKFSGAIPGILTLITKNLNYFRLHDNPDLCWLDAASNSVANECHKASEANNTDTLCPYPTCACTELTVCPSGATKSSSAAVNPVEPFYPADDTTCCPVGALLLEKLVSEGHLDCPAGYPCVATTGTEGMGTLALTL
jgi:hypothetical protein